MLREKPHPRGVSGDSWWLTPGRMPADLIAQVSNGDRERHLVPSRAHNPALGGSSHEVMIPRSDRGGRNVNPG